MITVLLLRHADIDVPPPIGNPDPSLNSNGVLRAHELARTVGASGLESIFTSSLKRTKETAVPLAALLNLATPPAVVPDPATFATHVRAGDFGAVVLVVGHSNTVPQMIDELVSPQPHLTVQGFDNLYIVSLSASESKLICLKYGA